MTTPTAKPLPCTPHRDERSFVDLEPTESDDPSYPYSRDESDVDLDADDKGAS